MVFRLRRNIPEVEAEIVHAPIRWPEEPARPVEPEPVDPRDEVAVEDEAVAPDTILTAAPERRPLADDVSDASIPELPESSPWAPDDPMAETICEIALWRGYYNASFYARAFTSAGEEVAIAESPQFRWRGADSSEQALAAHEALVEQLLSMGWTCIRGGEDTAWYQSTFRLGPPRSGDAA